MCLLIVLHRVVPQWPLVVAANREERYERGGEMPRLLSDNPRVFGGYDPKAGGTWLAVNQWTMLCAVANRARRSPPPEPVRSRGLLCLEAARQRSCIAVADAVSGAVGRDSYEGFNLFCAGLGGGHAFYYDGSLREKPLHDGVFVITRNDANDLSDDKIRRVHEILDAHRPASLPDWIERLEAICRDNGAAAGGDANSICMHGEHAGTVSSTILAFHAHDPKRHLLRHCSGHPCEGAYLPLRWPEGFFDPSPPPRDTDRPLA